MARKLDKIVTVRVTETERKLFRLVCEQNKDEGQDLLRQFILKYIKENVVK